MQNERTIVRKGKVIKVPKTTPCKFCYSALTIEEVEHCTKEKIDFACTKHSAMAKSLIPAATLASKTTASSSINHPQVGESSLKVKKVENVSSRQFVGSDPRLTPYQVVQIVDLLCDGYLLSEVITLEIFPVATWTMRGYLCHPKLALKALSQDQLLFNYAQLGDKRRPLLEAMIRTSFQKHSNDDVRKVYTKWRAEQIAIRKQQILSNGTAGIGTGSTNAAAG